jgi:hypothetical protein
VALALFPFDRLKQGAKISFPKALNLFPPLNQLKKKVG